MKLPLAFAALAFASVASAQINFFDNHDAGSTFTNTTVTGGNPFVLETNGANAHTANSYWRQREPGSVSDSVLTSPTLTYTATTTGPVTLDFWHKFGFESGFDGGTVELQVNGGGWNNIGQAAWLQNGYTHTISVNFSSPIGGQSAFSGNSPGFTTTDNTTNWLNSIADLGTFNVGDTFAVRFRGASDSSVSANGWFIDEVSISAAGVVPEPATMAALGLGVMALLRKRRKS